MTHAIASTSHGGAAAIRWPIDDRSEAMAGADPDGLPIDVRLVVTAGEYMGIRRELGYKVAQTPRHVRHLRRYLYERPAGRGGAIRPITRSITRPITRPIIRR